MEEIGRKVRCKLVSSEVRKVKCVKKIEVDLAENVIKSRKLEWK